ncbi:response regulator [Paenibacillus sp. FSL K6-1096]|uniref:response regulator transcription factor n=1 Tax=Paenibacillus sp. FSL K6-1096 TaxID=2921460 RepID=UPI0030EEA80A
MSNNGRIDTKVLKMLIVDDEPVICKGLRLTVDWAALGIEVIGEAYDGEEALQMMGQHEVNFVLSDIRMAGMDGLQLAEQVGQRYPEARMIIISGYEDFDYARQAIRLGVNDYLLKPVNIDELTGVVAKLAEDIRQQKQEGGKDELKLWLTNMARHGMAYRKAAPSSLQGAEFRILASQLGCFHERYGGLGQEAYEQLQERWISSLHGRLALPGLKLVSIFDHENLLITLAVSERRLEPPEWREWLDGFVPGLIPGAELHGGVSRAYTDAAETAERCAEAAELLRYAVLGNSAVLEEDVIRQWSGTREPAVLDIAGMVQSLVAALFKQDAQETGELVSEMLNFFKRESYLLHEIVTVYEELFALLRQRLRKSGITGMDYGRQSPDLYLYNSYDALQALILKDMADLLELIEQNGTDRSYWIVEKAKRYIEAQYLTDLKASEVAAWLKITPSYFSYIFKQSTGKGFTEYMNGLRIEQAKALLAETHDKVFEIADKVGYKEYKYFVTVFKSYTGMTPKEYRGLRAGKD